MSVAKVPACAAISTQDADAVEQDILSLLKLEYPDELYIDEHIKAQLMTQFRAEMPGAIRSQKQCDACTCASNVCPHKAPIAPMFLYMMNTVAMDCVKFKGDFGTEFRTFRYPIYDYVHPHELFPRFNVGVNTVDVFVMMPSTKIEHFYKRIRIGEPYSRECFTGWDKPMASDGALVLEPTQQFTAFEGVEFTGLCRPVRVVLQINDQTCEIPLVNNSTLVDGFYLPFPRINFTRVYLRFYFADSRVYDAATFQINVVVGYIMKLSRHFLDNTKYCFQVGQSLVKVEDGCAWIEP